MLNETRLVPNSTAEQANMFKILKKKKIIVNYGSRFAKSKNFIFIKDFVENFL